MKEWLIEREFKVLESSVWGRTAVSHSFDEEAARSARRFHEAIPGYRETPLTALPGLAKLLGVKAIYVKDESKRFSLNAFKGLGGSYAMFRIICEKLGLDPETTSPQDLKTQPWIDQVRQIEFVTATDGNHGKGVSWAAGIFGCRAHIYMPYGSQEVRAEAIRRVGPSEVEITNLSYDEAVKFAKQQSEKYGWILIQDTAWDGYEKIPFWIIQGYLTMISEAAEEMDRNRIIPTHVFLQAGVGAMAGGVLGFLTHHYTERKPVVTMVEPSVAACLYRSAKAGDGQLHSVGGTPVTIMAGLNCGTPCKITWPVIENYADFFISCPDYVAAEGMRMYAAGVQGDPAVISGESGAVTLGAVSQLLRYEGADEIKKRMGLNKNSVLLFINTEGDTDPENYQNIVSKGKYPLPEMTLEI